MSFFSRLFRRRATAVAEVQPEVEETKVEAQVTPEAAPAPAPVPEPEVVKEPISEETGEILRLDRNDRITSKPRPTSRPPQAGPAEVTPIPAARAPKPGLAVEDDDDLMVTRPDSGLEIDQMKSARRPNRNRKVKTRLMGFEHLSAVPEPEAPEVEDEEVATEVAKAPKITHPVGWLVVIDGPGMGEWFTLAGGLDSIGRGEDQSVRLNFGDSAISRQNHAALAYDSADHAFLLGDGGKANSVSVNGKPIKGTKPIVNGDIIVIGDTTLRLVALCDKDFNWQLGGGEADAKHA